MAGLMALAIATGFAWIAIPAALATVALAAGALVLELRARRDADVMLHAAPFIARRPRRRHYGRARAARGGADGAEAPAGPRGCGARLRARRPAPARPAAAGRPAPPATSTRPIGSRPRSSVPRPTPRAVVELEWLPRIRSPPRIGSGASSGCSSRDRSGVSGRGLRHGRGDGLGDDPDLLLGDHVRR